MAIVATTIEFEYFQKLNKKDDTVVTSSKIEASRQTILLLNDHGELIFKNQILGKFLRVMS